MAATEPRDELEVRAELREERRRLVESLDELRGGIEAATDLRAQLEGRIRPVLPLAVTGALGAGFVLGGGVGATARLLLRRRREGRVRATAGRFAVVDRR